MASPGGSPKTKRWRLPSRCSTRARAPTCATNYSRARRSAGPVAGDARRSSGNCWRVVSIPSNPTPSRGRRRSRGPEKWGTARSHSCSKREGEDAAGCRARERCKEREPSGRRSAPEADPTVRDVVGQREVHEPAVSHDGEVADIDEVHDRLVEHERGDCHAIRQSNFLAHHDGVPHLYAGTDARRPVDRYLLDI